MDVKQAAAQRVQIRSAGCDPHHSPLLARHLKPSPLAREGCRCAQPIQDDDAFGEFPAMIHHVSIPAERPEHVAAVLAELMGGRAFPFPGPLRGAFVAVSGDAHGTTVEVYPANTVIEPGKGEAPGGFAERETGAYGAFHFLLSVKLELEEIERIGAREGWRTKLFGRGAPNAKPVFQVIEFWIENRIMVELAPESMIADYQKAISFASLDAFFSNRKVA
jgi:hypothetical protein